MTSETKEWVRQQCAVAGLAAATVIAFVGAVDAYAVGGCIYRGCSSVMFSIATTPWVMAIYVGSMLVTSGIAAMAMIATLGWNGRRPGSRE